ncbi:interferon-induced helicase C domain-containing protein 1 isoform X1 [Xiphophorus hellerii]|uniref:interferon-induced helicase C domain-containing protein 1 isoform X1 n=1 Tax=Xiphophorus hellerii TaxID=8084 RepID=UPI0013B433A8|nr:interferon-induced helicase C domain-containing protein 1 isoform X1 [Xiphophorus hellerii]
MASDNDELYERRIECLRPRLRQIIKADEVLPHLQLESGRKEQITQKLKTEGYESAANLLIGVVVERPHTVGWFRAFVDALSNGGNAHAADYLQLNLPDPEVEAENDYYVRLIQLFSPRLEDMKTEEVSTRCLAQRLLTNADQEKILAEKTNQGNIHGARELLSRIVRCRPGWFSEFREILRVTEHKHLYELIGGSPECKKPKNVAAAEEKPAESCQSEEPMEISGTEGSQDDATDLYLSADLSKSMNNLHLDMSGCPAAEAAGATGGDPEEISLRDYQMEVARPALEGENIIICLPTGSGKTRVAVYITQKHLDSRKAEGKPGKVVVLVNKIPLVEQHFSTEFSSLKLKYKVERVSGDSELKISFANIVERNDIIICTAQILENYLERASSGEDEGVKLSDLTLIIIDECHHTQKGEVYNHIMMRYLKQKHKNKRLIKEQKQPVPLPQILGLTASPGVGGAKTLNKAEEHILRICANLDVSKIMTGSIDKKELRKSILPIEPRKEDPFGCVVKTIMTAIHEHARLFPTCDLGSQNYEQWAVQKEREAAKDGDQTVRVCAEYLRRYNEGLILSNTIRMCDALSFLNKFHEEQIKKKTSQDEQNIEITETERFLFNLFKDKKEELEKLAKDPTYENDSLSKLRTKILQEFSSRQEARGIIFIKTRHSAMSLSQWIEENPKFADIGVKPSYFIGGGDQSDTKPMTAAEQKDVLKRFKTGELNLLIATTVAEEGLDIKACNFVIRYGHVTNEIAMIQSQGRGRAEDSTYTVVDVKNSGVAEKEYVNEYREKMMNKAIQKIKKCDQSVYNKQITEFQIQAIMEERVRQANQKKKAVKDENPSAVKFSCRNCTKYICNGEDIKIIENMHRVNVTPQFRNLFIRRENVSLQERRLDYETNGVIACSGCGQTWGSMMWYRGIELPCLHVKNFVVDINTKKYSNCTRWIDLPVKFPDFDYIEHASLMAQGSDDEDTEWP